MSLRATVALIAASAATVVHADPVERDAFAALERPKPAAVFQYGPASSQALDVFLPTGKGPHPVAILIHGGCWRDLPAAGREQVRPIAAELAKQGIAGWSVGYRRADENGGGYPSTFQDVATAIDELRSQAARYNLDTSRTVVIGHSAGGHLALWASVRDRLPATDPYADISPAQLPPPPSRVVMVSGILDRLVPPYVADDYARLIRRTHSQAVTQIDIPGAGHFDLVTPGTPALREVESQIVEALNIGS